MFDLLKTFLPKKILPGLSKWLVLDSNSVLEGSGFYAFGPDLALVWL